MTSKGCLVDGKFEASSIIDWISEKCPFGFIKSQTMEYPFHNVNTN